MCRESKSYHSIIPCLVFLLILTLCPGCGGGGGTGGGSSSTAAQGGTSRIELTFQNPGYQKLFSFLNKKTVKELPSTTKSLAVKLYDAASGQQILNTQTVTFTSTQSSATVTFELVPAGSYTVYVAAYDSSAILVAEGKSPVSVTADTVQEVTVVMTAVPPPVNPPTITAVSPLTGPPGTVVTVTGTYFGTEQGAGSLTIGSSAGSVSSWSDTTIIAVVPAGASTGIITVLSSAGLSAAGPEFSVTPASFQAEMVAVCNEGEATVTLIDSYNDTALKTLDFSTSTGTVRPHSIDFSPSGDKMVLTNPTGAQVMITPTSALVATQSTIPFNGTTVGITDSQIPYEVTLRPNSTGDGRGFISLHSAKWAMIDLNEDTVGVVSPDPPFTQIGSTVLTSPSITYAVFNPVNSNAYLIGNDTSRIAFTLVVDRTSLSINSQYLVDDTAITGGLRLENIMGVVTPNGGKLFNIAGTFNPLEGGIAYFTALPELSFSYSQKAIVGSKPTGICILPDGSRLYVANSDSNNVSVVDVATSTVTSTITGFSTPTMVAVNPGGTKIYVTNKSGNSVSVIDTATNTVIKTISVGQSPSGISVAPLKL